MTQLPPSQVPDPWAPQAGVLDVQTPHRESELGLGEQVGLID